MPAPTFDLTVQGTAPNQYSTESLLEAAINAALTALWQDLNGSKADIANSGKVFPSRESAVTAGQEVLRPALSQIMTREGNYLVVRSASGTADDPLFEAYPQWGAVMRIPNDIRVAADIANGMTQARPIAMLSPGGTGAHYTATSNWPLTTGVSLISFAPPVENADFPDLTITGPFGTNGATETRTVLLVGEDGLAPMPGQLRAGARYYGQYNDLAIRIIGLRRPAQSEEKRVTDEAQAGALMHTMASSALEAGGTEDVGIKVTGTGNFSFWTASRGDRGNVILVDGGVRWIDLSHLRPGCDDPITIRCITAARFRTPAQNYAATAGSLVRVYRTTTADYVFEAIGGTVTTISDVMPACNFCFITGGQSLASNFLTAGLHGFQRGLLDYNGTARAVFAIDGATGSTGLLPESAGGPGYWWNDGDSTPGPAALAWKAALDAKPSNQPVPAFIYWAMGQNDVGYMGAGIMLARYIAAYQALFAWMRAQIGSNVPIIWSPLGSWDVDGAPSDDKASAIRWAEHSVRAAVTGVHFGPHTFDLPRSFYDVHPTEQGQVIQGYRLAAHVAALLYGNTPNNGPSISALTAVDGGLSYRIDFTPGDPGDPLWRTAWVDGLAFYKPGQDPLSGADVVQTRHLWENNTRLRVWLAEAVTGATLLWPAGTLKEARAGRYVRNTGNSPLRVGIGNHVPLKPARITAS
ncbi:hypothetical protein PY32053_01637 [Paracoccus yeei]|uniref:Uncharacterized protein n=3 Tax=Paracoccus yeei TaxID=147645 RepID=A0A386UKM5_9RHOB|nr:hypothetical protein [Paracoccus yeei]AYF01264.1 hypothetical protein PY32053_01637 [Paracoccus yeei]